MYHFNEDHFNEAIKSHARHGQIDECFAQLWQMEQLGIRISVMTFNTIITALVSNKEFERAEHLVQLMQSCDIQPDVITYNVMINGCAVVGDCGRAKQWVQRMERGNVPPDVVTYASLCKVLSQDGNTAEIKRIMGVVEANGWLLDEFFFGALLSACSRTQPPDTHCAEIAFGDLVKRGLKPKKVKRALSNVVGPQRLAHLFSRLGKAQRPSAGQ